MDTYALSPLKGLQRDFETIAEQSHVHILRRILSLGDTEDDVFVVLEHMVAAEASHGLPILGLDPGIGALEVRHVLEVVDHALHRDLLPAEA